MIWNVTLFLSPQILDVLWSDPQSAKGSKPNIQRGGGSYFGPDVTSDQLSHNKLGLLVRSHECCPQGWKIEHNNSVMTIFSASNYYGLESNSGAFIQMFSKRIHSDLKNGEQSVEEEASNKITILMPTEVTTSCDEDSTMSLKPPSSLLLSNSAESKVLYSRATNRKMGNSGSSLRSIQLLIQPRVVKFQVGKFGEKTSADRK